jgi:tRNA(Arg) A34 adenosine deaminase TadA
MYNLEKLMHTAIEEARISLREGNSGFGALIIKGLVVISKAHDTDKISGDPTQHAEMNVIRSAAAKLGRDLSDCVLISTHEPCPMCSTATLWSGISEVAYGYSIKEAIAQGRKRIDIQLKEIFDRAGDKIVVHEKVLHETCAVLYNRAVRDSIDQLRDTDEKKLKLLAHDLTEKRLKWFSKNCSSVTGLNKDVIDAGYRVVLKKLGITQDQAEIAIRDDKSLILHSKNFCPTFEAYKILGLDTRFVCRHLTEQPTTKLLRKVNPRLRFTRNYDKLRPYSNYCEEMIILDA